MKTKSAELTLDEAIKQAQKWQRNSEAIIAPEIVTGLVDGAIALRDAAKFARSVLAANPMELSERMAIEKLDAALVDAQDTTTQGE